MKISHLNDFCFLFLEFLGVIIFCNFICCTTAFGPYLAAKIKALILHEQNIDHGIRKIFNGGATAHTVLAELDDQKLLSRGMASIKSNASYIS